MKKKREDFLAENPMHATFLNVVAAERAFEQQCVAHFLANPQLAGVEMGACAEPVSPIAPDAFWLAMDGITTHSHNTERDRFRQASANKRWVATVVNHLIAAAPGAGEPIFLLGE